VHFRSKVHLPGEQPVCWCICSHSSSLTLPTTWQPVRDAPQSLCQSNYSAGLSQLSVLLGKWFLRKMLFTCFLPFGWSLEPWLVRLGLGRAWVRRAGVRRSQVPQVCQGTRQDGGLASSHIVGKPEAPLPQEETHQDAQAEAEDCHGEAQSGHGAGGVGGSQEQVTTRPAGWV